MNAPAHPIEVLQAELADLDWITEPARVQRLSQDFSWFSPVLKRQLQDKSAQAVVRPRTLDEIRRLLSSCARRRVPVTIRGAGTGNYGQSTPLQGGVVLDMSGYASLVWSRQGAARVQAGMRLWDLEKAVAPQGWELRCLPSTWRSATVGGLFGGGFGGVGSYNWGPLASAGNLRAVQAITLEEEPQLVELRGPDALALHHLWGTNGLVLEVELSLAPLQDWTELLLSFESLGSAVAFGDALSRSPGIPVRELAVLSAPIPDLVRPLATQLQPGASAAIVAVGPAGEPALEALLAAHGGRIASRKAAAEVRSSNRTLMEYTWNHTTLHALKTDPGLTYLQVAFTPGQHIAQLLRMDAMLAPEVLTHAEFIRNPEGQMMCSALQLVRFTTEERLQEIMAIYREHGVRVNDPHTFIVEDGKHQGQIAPGAVAMKRRFDPLNLLNPGKVRAWRDGIPA